MANFNSKIINLAIFSPQWYYKVMNNKDAQVAYEEVSNLLQASVVPVAGRISDVSESSWVDPLDVFEYEQPIHHLLLCEQLARQPQPQLNAKKRAILIDWLVVVAAN